MKAHKYWSVGALITMTWVRFTLDIKGKNQVTNTLL